MKNKTISILRAPVLQACCRRGAGIRRAAMLLLATLLLTMTAQTVWADSWPEYITDVVLAGGTESEAASVKNSSTYSGYTWCSTSLNDGTNGDVIYIGYKKGSRANVNGGYITDFVVVETGSSHNPSSTFSLNGKTYYLCPTAGGNYFANTNHGNLTSQASQGWNMYLYYTKANFDDKRAVNGITIYSVNNKSDHRSGAINCYNTDGTLKEENISLNRGVSNTPYVYMHINTVTKTNRPSVDPVMASGLTYNGSAKQLIATGATLASGTMYYRLGTSGSFTSTVADVKATAAGSYTVYYYAGANSYSNQSDTHSATVTIAKSANNGVTVSCSNYLEGTTPVPSLVGTNLSTGAVTYKFSTSQNGTYTTTVPTDIGKYYVTATVAGDDNCDEYTTAPVSFCILADVSDLWNIKGGANGTAAHPFIISNPAGLNLLASKVNGGRAYSGKYFALGANITYDGTENNYTPIGRDGTEFGGHFDGKGHTVSGININLPSNNYIGLFGKAIESTTIQNLTLDNSRIAGYSYCGGIVGYNSGGTVDNCHVTSSVTILAPNSVTEYHGGIVGRNGSGIVRGCTSAATLKYDDTSHSYYGGIAGYNYTSGTIRDCLVYGGSVSGTFRVGAVVGYNSGTLTNNHYSGVTLNGSKALLDAGVGGDGSQDGTCYICAIIPYEGVTLSIPSVSATTEYPYDGLKIYPTGMTYKGQYYNYISNADAGISGDVTFTATYSGSVPEDYAFGGFGSTSIADNKNVEMEWEATDGSATCTLYTGYAAIYYIAPTFRNAIWGDGDGTQGNPYIIKTVRGMNELASRVNSGEGLGGKYFELGADITYDGTENNYTPIGTSDHPFSANFDGKGYTISGINITNKNSYANPIAGIFGYAKSCTIQNITLANSTFSKTGHTGGIFSSSERITVSNCHVTNTVTLDDMLGSSFSGGIGGYAEYSVIQGCTNDATMTYRYYESGGIMGCMRGGTIKDCLYLGPKINAEWNSFILYVTMNARPTMSNNYYIFYGETPRYGGVFAMATTDKPEGASETATATYGTGSYTGITVFGNVLYYDGKYYWHDENLMELADRNEDNSSVIAGNNRQTRNVVLKDRTLYKDGSWNTLCLPFAVDLTASGTLSGDNVQAMTLNTTSSNLTDGTLTLNFDAATGQTIPAGTPFIIKWDESGTDIENPVFEGVTIDATKHDATVEGVLTFTGTYAPVIIADGGDNTMLYLGSANTLYYPTKAMTIGCHRAYFQLLGDLTAGEPTSSSNAQQIHAFNLNFGDDEATGIVSAEANSSLFILHSPLSEWYTLDGRKLDGQPTQRGIYIHGGKKVVVK